MKLVKDISLFTRAARSSLAAIRERFFKSLTVHRDEAWFRHYDAGVPFHMELPDKPLYHFLDEAAVNAGQKTAFIYFNRKFTYRRLHDLALRFANGLQKLGVKPGDRVALCLPNIPQFLISYWAALYTGAVIVPISPLLSERELHQQIVESQAKILVILDRFYSRISRFRAQTLLSHVVVACIETYMPPLMNLAMRFRKRMQRTIEKIKQGKDTLFFRQLLAHKPLSMAVPIRTALPALLLFTGGVTGIAKAAMLSHRSVVANTLQARVWIGDVKDRNEVVLGVLPFTHSYGMTACHHLAVQAKATLILQPRFELKRVVREIKRYRVTLFPGVPTMYGAIVNYAGRKRVNLSSVRACISGGAPLPISTQRDFEKLTQGHLVEGYGLTEASPITHCNPLRGLRKFGSIGLPFPNTEARICDLVSRQPLAIGQIGEIQVRGPQVMSGYWQRPEETAAVLSDDRWLRTGDVGYRDQDGFFFIVDRKKDIIFSGGYNIYPSEVECVLREHPEVSDASAVAMPDDYYGAVVKAYVIAKLHCSPTETELIQFCLGKLAKYKIPRKIVFRRDLPTSILGKVLKRELVHMDQPV
jgi:long-chain acyl-CoA synthetase